MPHTVQAKNVAYAYPQHGYGLAPISLNLLGGDAVLIAGPSGSGKSTLARCLGGLIPHLYRGNLSGEVWLDGLRTSRAPLWQLAERAGLVFQNPSAQMLTVRTDEEIIFGLENLGLPRAIIQERLEAALVRFGMEPFRQRSPQTLSGGEQQKLALAAIMARQPPVLILDEPLSMLDSTAATHLVAHLADLARAGTTVVVCEHRAEYLQAIPDLRTVCLNGSAHEPSAPPADVPAHFDFTSHASHFTLNVSNLHIKLGGRPILQDLSFSADGGQVLAIVGCNGVGKTTLLRALAGLQKHSGEITVDGQRPDLGMVFQNPDLQLFNANVRDEVLYGVEDPDLDRYTWLMAMLGLSRYDDTPPLLLSEGEKKRLALAVTLMRGPRHGVLLDEPALGQDAAHKEILMRLAHALADAGQLVIVTTHDLVLAAQADRLLILGQDGFVADGPPGEILHDEVPWGQVGLHVPDWVMGG
ncbi:MAG: ABC transporter ATP-binding protein [Anaerolineae bacterium]|jgi:energy-coupling factor transport system ATP-binding protein